MLHQKLNRVRAKLLAFIKNTVLFGMVLEVGFGNAMFGICQCLLSS